MTQPVCAVVGVGPGNGAASAHRFAKAGYSVALLARNREYLDGLATKIDGSRAYTCDVTDSEQIGAAFAAIREEIGEVETLIYNAGSGVFGSIEQTTPQLFESAWRVNALGALLVANEVIPSMKKAGSGNIVFIGATASLRGGGNFAAFASAKAAQRNLAQSMARHLGPSGVHVSLIIIDGVIDIPRTRELLPDRSEEEFLRPEDIAESTFQVTRQPRSAWSFEIDLRPFGEKW